MLREDKNTKAAIEGAMIVAYVGYSRLTNKWEAKFEKFNSELGRNLEKIYLLRSMKGKKNILDCSKKHQKDLKSPTHGFELSKNNEECSLKVY
jgi:hypothetical protein